MLMIDSNDQYEIKDLLSKKKTQDIYEVKKDIKDSR